MVAHRGYGHYATMDRADHPDLSQPGPHRTATSYGSTAIGTPKVPFNTYPFTPSILAPPEFVIAPVTLNIPRVPFRHSARESLSEVDSGLVG